MHCFLSVFMCFYCVFTAETCNFGTFHMYTRKHMYHTLYMKCTVFQVFSCVFFMFSLEKHVILVHLHVYKKTHVSYFRHEMHCFLSVFISFYCVFTSETCIFGTFHMFKRKHMYPTLYMKFTVFQVFSLCFTAEACNFDTFYTYTRKHMYHTLYMKCTVFHVFSYVFTVFSLSFHCKNM
jgi:hypothetical protein